LRNTGSGSGLTESVVDFAVVEAGNQDVVAVAVVIVEVGERSSSSDVRSDGRSRRRGDFEVVITMTKRSRGDDHGGEEISRRQGDLKVARSRGSDHGDKEILRRRGDLEAPTVIMTARRSRRRWRRDLLWHRSRSQRWISAARRNKGLVVPR